MSDHTPGRWHWWTSNSWRRLMSDQDGGRRTVPVLEPACNPRDQHPDLLVSDADMGIIAAANDMWAVLDDLEGTLDGQIYPEAHALDFDAPDDHQYTVTITAKQWRAIGAALTKAKQG